MSRRVWETVETKAGEVRMAKVKRRRRERKSRKKKRREEKEKRRKEKKPQGMEVQKIAEGWKI